ncbi:MAG: type III pantothenate kinase [Solirubrobacteraceae bacterium]
MLLAVNIGNSNIRFGIYEKNICSSSWTINTKPYKLVDEYFITFKNIYNQYNIGIEKVTKIVIGSVVPSQTMPVKEALERLHNCVAFIVDRNTPSEITHESKQMGSDLYANAVAAHIGYKGKKLIIDFGTALTFVGIDEEGKLMGVVIAPGVNTSLNALIGDTAQLSDIALEKPNVILGKDTQTCMQSGMIYGFLSLIEGMIDRIKKEYGSDITVIATGGLGHIYFPLTTKIDVFNRLHTLDGLKHLFYKNVN